MNQSINHYNKERIAPRQASFSWNAVAAATTAAGISSVVVAMNASGDDMAVAAMT